MLYNHSTNKDYFRYDNYIYDIRYKQDILPNTVIINIYRHDFFEKCKNPQEITTCFEPIYDQLLKLDCEYYFFTVAIGETTNPRWTNAVFDEIRLLLTKLGGKLKNYICLLNSTVDDSFYPTDINILVVPWCLLSTIAWYKNTNLFYTWKPENEKILFLPGKLDKPNRLPILYHLLDSKYKDNLLYTCNHNYFFQANFMDYLSKMVEQLNLYTNKTWDLNSLIKYLGSIQKDIDIGSDLRNRLHVTPTEFYKEVKLEIVPETWIDTVEHLSEKSFKPIVLGYPFLHINRKFKNSLEVFNLKTFDDFLPEFKETYDKMEYINQFLIDLPVLISSISQNANKIQEIIDHNKKQSNLLYDHFTQEISKYIPDFLTHHDLIFTQFLAYSVKSSKSYESLQSVIV